MRAKQSRSGQRWTGSWPELSLLLGGVLALSYCALHQWSAHAAMRSAKAMAQQTRQQTAAPTSSSVVNADGVIGIVTIPQLHLSAPITSGVGRIELIRGVGHIPGTAFPGGLGTLGLAGHRDTFFRALRHVESGMLIRVTGAAGTFRYQIDSTEIVDPDQVSVLDIDSQPELVLVTCYPFDYIGAAPRRFIVHARLLSAAPDEER